MAHRVLREDRRVPDAEFGQVENPLDLPLMRFARGRKVLALTRANKYRSQPLFLNGTSEGHATSIFLCDRLLMFTASV